MTGPQIARTIRRLVQLGGDRIDDRTSRLAQEAVAELLAGPSPEMAEHFVRCVNAHEQSRQPESELN